jgi:hypothetical protein
LKTQLFKYIIVEKAGINVQIWVGINYTHPMHVINPFILFKIWKNWIMSLFHHNLYIST